MFPNDFTALKHILIIIFFFFFLRAWKISRRRDRRKKNAFSFQHFTSKWNWASGDLQSNNNRKKKCKLKRTDKQRLERERKQKNCNERKCANETTETNREKALATFFFIVTRHRMPKKTERKRQTNSTEKKRRENYLHRELKWEFPCNSALLFH